MSEGIDKLKEIGAQKIHETTHISKQYVQGMLHESFDDMNKIQFLGFVSILEREYHINLDSLRAKGNEYFNDIVSTQNSKDKIFVTPKKKRNYSLFYIIIAVVVFIAVTAFTITNFSSAATDKKVQLLDNNIESIAENIPPLMEELNTTVEEEPGIIIEDENLTEIDEDIVPEAVLVAKSLKIIPNVRVWIGYIDLQTFKKYQTFVSDELVLDPEKDWILVCGHGDLNIELNSEIQEFKTKNNLKFSYIDGVLKKITHSEFKQLNRGSGW